jgi:hypothetical protein
MTALQKRFLLFLIGCIGTRLTFALIAKNASPALLSIMGYIALIPALGFTFIYLFGLRKTGPEVFGDKIWWNSLRPLHAALYFSFAYLAINKSKNAWLALLADVIIGFLSFMGHHYAVGNIAKVLNY